MIKTDLQRTLDENISEDVISKRVQGGVDLSYLEAWYVIDRLNQVLGQGNWSYGIANLTKVFEGEVEQYSGKAFSTSYTATVFLNVNVDGKMVCFSDVGYGQGSDKKNPGNAHEMATKGAVSDALKRTVKNLGRSMGLALYDKEQQYVGTQEVKTTAIQKVPLTISGNVGNPTEKVPTMDANKTGISISETPRPFKELITETFKTLEAQNKISLTAFKTNYLGGKGLSTVAPSELPKIYEKMKKDFFTTSNGKGA